MESYDEMLKIGLEKMPKDIKKDVRLEIPKPSIFIQGNQTTINNFVEIANTLRRDPKHLSKFLFRELAKPGNLDDKRLVIQGKVYRDLVERKINEYVKEFVECKECGKLDTNLVKDKRVTFLKCEACGASESVRNI